MQSYSNAIGKTDLDLFWEEQAPALIEADQEVIYTRCNKLLVESVKSFEGEVKHYLSHKMPLQNQSGDIIGIFGISCLINSIDSISVALNEMSAIINKPLLEHNVTLAKRQIECLSYLVRGMTMKQIAKNMGLSPKTVEHYLEAIKLKLKCRTRQESIEKALQLSYFKVRSLSE